ncbi:MAG: hypothetical protein AAF993_18255 [Pseudomonadota bacterium]
MVGKGFSILITLAVGIAALVGGVLWWIGPSLAHLAFVDDRRADPYLVAEFLRGPVEPLQTRYIAPLQQLVTSEGGQSLAAYQLQYVANGQTRDEWPRLVFYRIPHARDVAQIMTSSPYGLMQDSITGLQAMRLGSYANSAHDEWQNTLLIFLVIARESTQLDPLTGLLAAATGSGGRVVLDAQIDPLDAEPPWQRMLVMDFPSDKVALDWLNSTAIGIERDLTSSANRDFAVMLYKR